MKHKSTYSCESVIYCNLGSNIIQENYDFEFYFNKTDIKPTVLDEGYEIILANWSNDKHIMCNVKNDIPVKILSFPYVFDNRSVKQKIIFLESIAACHDTKYDLVMYFTVNMGFVNYLDNLTDSLEIPILQNWTTHEQILPISLQASEFDSSLLKPPIMLKDFLCQFHHKKTILICKNGIIVK